MKTLSEFQYVDAGTVDEAANALSQAGSNGYVIAGGTDLIGTMRFHILRD
jgi:CO/xanthine dehydrogenase FAD-binding subunit